MESQAGAGWGLERINVRCTVHADTSVAHAEESGAHLGVRESAAVCIEYETRVQIELTRVQSRQLAGRQCGRGLLWSF